MYFSVVKILSSLQNKHFLHKTQFARVKNALFHAQNMIFCTQNCGRDLITYQRRLNNVLR